jgi:uncharacterized protein YbaP (TraB family)
MRAIAAFALIAAMVIAPTASAAGPAFSQGLLFRLDKPGARTSWVFGTIHSSDPRALELPLPVTRAFARARTYAAEIMLGDVDVADFFAMAQFADGRRLADYFDDDTLAAIRVAFGASAPAEATLAKLKPWAVLLQLGQAPTSATDERPTLDASLLAAARVRRMPVVSLELAEEQASAFDAIPLETQVALVHYVLQERDALVQQHAQTLRAWLDRDLARIRALSEAPGKRDPLIARHFALLSHHLIDNRSVSMAHRLFLPLRHGGVFVAVGALHLYGDRGLLALLRDQGYRIQRVY